MHMLAVPLKKETSKLLDQIKIDYIKKNNKNITKKEILKRLLYIYNHNESYQNEVNECLKVKDSDDDKNLLSFWADADIKTTLLQIAVEKNVSQSKILHCLVVEAKSQNLELNTSMGFNSVVP